MGLSNVITLLLTFGATMLPQMVTALPHEWQAVASGLVATGSAILHLYAKPPGDNGVFSRVK